MMSRLASQLKVFTPRDLLIIFVLALIYFIAGKLGLRLAFFNPSATAVWPPTGIAIAAFLIFGAKVWPGIFLGAFFVNVTTAGNIGTSFGIATGNTLEGLVALYLIKRFIKARNPFLTPLDIFKYTLLAGFLSTAVSATIGTGTLYLGGFLQFADFRETWLTWWLGDMGGALIVAPLIFLWKFDPKFYWDTGKIKETVGISLLLALLGVLVFGRILPATLVDYSLAFIVIPILVWIAFRFTPKETATAVAVISAVAIVATLTGFGPFTKVPLNQSLTLLQIFMGVIFLAVMPLSAAAFAHRHSEERYKNLVETSPDPIVLIDLEGRVQVVNKQTLIMYGLTDEQEIVGKSGFDFVAKEDLAKAQSLLGEVIKKGSVMGVEYTSVHKDGSRFITSANASVLLDPSGKPLGIVGVLHDVTVERELDRAKTDFFALAAHQLRTPLTTMRWNTEMLISGKLGELSKAVTEKLESLQGSTLALIKLVDTFLHISMIEQGVLPNKPESTDVVLKTQEIIEETRPAAAKKSIKLNLKVDGDVGNIYIDPQRFKDIIYNLVANAIIYNVEEGTVDVVLNSKNGGVHIEVADSGVGISEQDRQKIFGKYYRGARAKDFDKEGVGIGLYMVKSYVEGLGGKIWFKSPVKNAKGTIFYIDLPSGRPK